MPVLCSTVFFNVINDSVSFPFTIGNLKNEKMSIFFQKYSKIVCYSPTEFVIAMPVKNCENRIVLQIAVPFFEI